MIKMFFSSVLLLLSLNSFSSSSLSTYDCTLDEGNSSVGYFHITVDSKNKIIVNKKSIYTAKSENDLISLFDTDEVGMLSLDQDFDRGFGFFRASLIDGGQDFHFTCSLDWSPY